MKHVRAITVARAEEDSNEDTLELLAEILGLVLQIVQAFTGDKLDPAWQ